jgi:hypothetical protein
LGKQNSQDKYLINEMSRLINEIVNQKLLNQHPKIFVATRLKFQKLFDFKKRNGTQYFEDGLNQRKA